MLVFVMGDEQEMLKHVDGNGQRRCQFVYPDGSTRTEILVHAEIADVVSMWRSGKSIIPLTREELEQVLEYDLLGGGEDA